MKKKKIGEILIENKLIDEITLNSALEHQNKCKKRLGEILIDWGILIEEQLLNILGKQLNCETIDLTEIKIEETVLDKIPPQLLKQYKIFPIKMENSIIHLAMADPLNIIAIDEIKLITGCNVLPIITSEHSLSYAFERYFGTQYKISQAVQSYKQQKSGENDYNKEDKLKLHISEIESAPIVRLVESIINDAIKKNASDIHWEPKKNTFNIRYRVDGVMHTEMSLNSSISLPVTSRIKILSNIDISEKRKPQDGRFTWMLENKNYDFRVSTIPTIWGEKIVLRILYKEENILNLKDLGFEEDDLQKYLDILSVKTGIILITGPTGSGKTTTLYASLRHLAKDEINILTIEDPVEYHIENINQVQLNKKIDLTFSSGLRAILRQDPDVIMVGEIRDKETAEIAIQSALTGHLVLSSLHTNDAPSTIIRLIEMGIEPYLINATLIGIVSQRLVRKLCFCKHPYTPSKEELLKVKLEGNFLPTFYKKTGCKSCNNYGYRGRIGIFEVMKITDKIRDSIKRETSIEEIRKKAIDEGLKILFQNATQKVINGLTSIEEMFRVIYT